LIRTWFETFVFAKSMTVSSELSDEMYLQLFRQLNFKRTANSPNPVKEKTKTVIVMFVLLTRYITPKEQLLSLLISWLNKLTQEKFIERFVNLAIKGLKTPRVHEASGRAYYHWPPSLYEIDAIFKDKKIEVNVMWPTGEMQTHHADETTTIESLLKTSIWT